MKVSSFMAKSTISAGLCGKGDERLGSILTLWLFIWVARVQKKCGLIKSKGDECGGKMKSFYGNISG
jgi:hypothetical protein